jgi:hypothetical protein
MSRLITIMLNVIMLNVALITIMLNVIMLSVVMLSVVILNVVMLSVVMLNVVMLNVAAPKHRFSIVGHHPQSFKKFALFRFSKKSLVYHDLNPWVPCFAP